MPIEQPSMVKMVALAGPDYEEGPNSQVPKWGVPHLHQKEYKDFFDH